MPRTGGKRRDPHHGRGGSERPVRRVSSVAELERLVASEPNLRLLSYDVVHDPMPHPSERVLDSLLSPKQRERLFEQVHDAPRQAIPALEALLERLPDSPVLLNWLVSSYQKAGDRENARRLAQLNYQRNPDYLFAKINHAHFLLLDNEIEQFERVFDGKYDLKLLYPHRKRFHVSELLALYGLVIEYLIRIKDLDRAEMLYEVMDEIAPEAEMTRWIHDVLLNAMMLRTVERMKERLSRPRKPRKPRKPRARKTPPSSPPPPPPPPAAAD